MDYSSCKTLIDPLVLNFLAMVLVKLRKKDFTMVLARNTPKCRNRAPSRNLPREAAEEILRFYVQLKRCLTIAKRNVLLFKPVHLQDVFATCAFEILQKIFRSSQVTEHQLI